MVVLEQPTDTGFPFTDRYGYPLAYLPARVASVDGQILRDERGVPLISDHLGEVLCAECALSWLQQGRDNEVLTIAYGIDGDIPRDTVCDGCGESFWQ